MASVEQCEQALHDLSARVAAVDPATRKKHVVNRTFACQVTDLGTCFAARLGSEGLTDVRQVGPGEQTDAQITLACTSDDLLKLVDGSLHVASAWATGRLHVDASVMDVLRLRTML